MAFQSEERGITAALGKQAIVVTPLNHMAGLEKDNLVGVAQGAKAVRYNDRGAVLHMALQGLANALLGLGIDGGG